MALIECPECKNQISDKAVSCPHCGFPISNDILNSYSVILDICGINRAQVVHHLMRIQNIKMSDAYNIINNTPYVIFKNTTNEKANEIKKTLEEVGAKVSIKNYDMNDTLNGHIKTDEVCCPRCGSAQITTGQRGFSFLTGFMGSNKTTNRCANCGHSWQPK